MLARVCMSSINVESCFSLRNDAYMEHTMRKKKKNPHAVALSKLGARKGGEARAATLSPQKRKEIAQSAARARWAKAKKVEEQN